VPAVWAQNARFNGGHLAVFVTSGVAAFAALAGMCGGSIFLGVILVRGSARGRRAAIALETFMAGFGVLVAYWTAASGAGITASAPVLAGLAGGGMSLAAAICLLLPAARRFTAG